MKCPECDGTGKVDGWDGWSEYDCEVCDGKGYLTEQEYIQHCNTEQLAEFINDAIGKCYTCGRGYTAHPAYCPFHRCLLGSVYGITEWLKQPHTTE